MEQDTARILRYHASMLDDVVRTESYRRAIHEVVHDGDVVLDLGTGTGVLAHFALEAGAARVYAVEQGVAVELARLLARGREDRLILVHGASQAVSLPEPADVLVSETLWNFGLGEGMVGSVRDARDRMLRPDARIVPRAVELIVAPVEHERAYRAAVEVWRGERYGLDFSPIAEFAANNHQQVMLNPDDLLAPPAILDRMVLSSATGPEASGRVGVTITRAGTLHGIGGWFRAELSPSVELTNAPPSRTPNWSHVFFPIERPISVAAGQELSLRIRSTGNGGVWSWRVDPGRNAPVGRRGVEQSTLWGYPAGSDDLRKRSGSFRPRRGVRGEVAARILALADGSRSVDEISSTILDERPDAFARERDAADRVRSIVHDYC